MLAGGSSASFSDIRRPVCRKQRVDIDLRRDSLTLLSRQEDTQQNKGYRSSGVRYIYILFDYLAIIQGYKLEQHF